MVIVGPTAVGKTSLAVKIAKEFDGALLSADSVQVFKTLDIISGKDKEEISDISAFLLDVVSPFESFSVSQFENLAKESIVSIISSNKLPVIVGGTGLYVKSIVDGIDTALVKPDQKLRDLLDKLSVQDLQKRLNALDKDLFGSLNDSDRMNKRRLIRKIEILKNRKKVDVGAKKRNLEFLQIGLELSREDIKKNIDVRVDERIKNGGLDEVRNLFNDYDDLTPQVKDANGYKQLFEHFLGVTSLDEAILKWKLSEYKHAKNQMTWFKKDTRIKWFLADRRDLFESIKMDIDTFLKG